MKRLTALFEKLKKNVLGKKNSFARSPREFKFADWKEALQATKNSIGTKNIGLLAAGGAYFATLASFPLMAASVAIASFFIDQHNLQDIVKAVENFLPTDIASLVSSQLQTSLHHRSANLVIAVVAILISLFSISGATQNLISANNSIYGLTERRSFIKLRITSFSLTALNLLIGAIVIVLLLLDTPFLTGFGFPYAIALMISIIRWLVLAVIISLVLSLFYRYGPDRPNPKWRWVSWGSLIATVVWMVGTALFFVYARYFANFSESYSLFAGIIVLMTWFNLTVFTVLLGAEINNQLENHTLRKTTK